MIRRLSKRRLLRSLLLSALFFLLWTRDDWSIVTNERIISRLDDYCPPPPTTTSAFLLPSKSSSVEFDNNNIHNNATTTAASSSSSFTIVILASNGLASLQRLVGVLNRTNYHTHFNSGHDVVHVRLWIHIIIVMNVDGEYYDPMYNWARSLVTTISDTTEEGYVDSNKGFYFAADILSSGTTTNRAAIPLQASFRSVRVVPDSSLRGTQQQANKSQQHSEKMSWLNDTTWKSMTDDDRVIILNDDINLSPLWYDWVRNMFDRYGQLDDLAGVSLESPSSILPSQTTTTALSTLREHVPEGEPFLYPLVGTGGGFAPRISVWRDFIEWSVCSLCLGVNVSTADVGDYGQTTQRTEAAAAAAATTTTPLWVQYFAKFVEHNGLYCLYQTPKNHKYSSSKKKLALATHIINSGVIGASSDSELVTGVEDPHFISRHCSGYDNPPVRFDLSMNPIVPSNQRVVVISTAVGEYREVGQFETFIGSLRKYYKGKIAMLIGNQSPDEVKDYLTSQNVQYETTEEGRSWSEFNVFRFVFYGNACSMADWCLTVDFRDVKFQSNPFPSNIFGDTAKEKSSEEKGREVVDMYVFAHNLVLNKYTRGGRWFHKNLPKCSSFRDHDVPSNTARLINAGGFYATPRALDTIRNYMVNHAECDDQITFNMFLHSGKNNTERPLEVVIFPQGYGPVNNVAFSSSYTLDTTGRIGGWDCFLSPIVHQYDRLFQSRLLNDNCIPRE